MALVLPVVVVGLVLGVLIGAFFNRRRPTNFWTFVGGAIGAALAFVGVVAFWSGPWMTS
jgi:hypothetical protein